MNVKIKNDVQRKLKKPCRLVGSLQSKSEKSGQDLQDLLVVEEEISRHQESLESLIGRIAGLHVYQPGIEDEIEELDSELSSELEVLRKFTGNTKARYQTSQQLVPVDAGQGLAALELRAEDASQAMEEKQRDQKRAKTVRTDYLADVDVLQAWIRETELKVQDRSSTPDKTMENVRQALNELPPMQDKLERLTRNGRTIVENIKDDSEKETITVTITNLTEQLGQLKTWLDEKRQQVGDTLDAWQRFLTLLESVKAWTAEKKVFLKEPLKLSSLNQARQRLHDYSVRIVFLSDEFFTYFWYCVKASSLINKNSDKIELI